VITQCSIRHIYALPTAPYNSVSSSESTSNISAADKTALLAISRTLTLRRCNHHTLPDPLSTLECYQSVIDAKGSGTNKHRYILAAQDEEVRQWARGVKGVPMIYVKRSVMVMEPMSGASASVRTGNEREKLRGGVKKNLPLKRKRDDVEEDEGREKDAEERQPKRKKKTYGAKGPNPLSVKKKKVKKVGQTKEKDQAKERSTAQPGDIPEANSNTQTEAERARHKANKHHNISSEETGLESSRAGATETLGQG
jgi:U3 small nucleolar RNA-associated protein 23